MGKKKKREKKKDSVMAVFSRKPKWVHVSQNALIGLSEK